MHSLCNIFDLGENRYYEIKFDDLLNGYDGVDGFERFSTKERLTQKMGDAVGSAAMGLMGLMQNIKKK